MTHSDASRSPVTAPTVHASAAEDEISLVELIAFLRRYFWLLAGGALAGALIAGLIAWFMTPIYRAEITVAPVAADSSGALSRFANQLGPLAGMLGGIDLGADGSRKELALGTLKSRELIRQLVEEGQLLPVLFPERYDTERQTWKVSRGGKSLEPTVNEAIDLLAKRVFTVTEDRRTGLVTVAAEWPDRERAAVWANQLVALTNTLLRQRVIDEARRNIAYLEQELEKTSVVERQQIIYRLIESRTSEIMLAEGRPEFAFTVVDPVRIPDADKPVRPRSALMVLLGFMLGGLIMLVAILLRQFAIRLNDGMPRV